MRRKEREQTEAFARRIIADAEYAVLSTVDEKAVPYAVAISPVLDGEYIYFHCATEGKKLDNIRRNPQICLTAVGRTNLVPEQFTTEYESAIVMGTAEIVSDEEKKLEALRLLCCKYTPEHLELAEETAKKAVGHTGIVRIRIEKITGKALHRNET